MYHKHARGAISLHRPVRVLAHCDASLTKRVGIDSGDPRQRLCNQAIVYLRLLATVADTALKTQRPTQRRAIFPTSRRVSPFRRPDGAIHYNPA